MQDAFFEDSALIGIASALPGYQMVHELNTAFDISLSREPELDICVQNKQDDAIKHFYGIYEYNLPLSSDRYLFYKLKSDKRALVPEIKNMDYLWLVQTLYADEEANKLCSLLRTMPFVQMAMVLEAGKIKNLRTLLV